MDSSYKTMLVDSFDMSRIESTLLERKKDLVQATSWMFNILLLGFVIVCFGLFLYTQYHSTTETANEVKRIPFEPIPWLSATRNVRMEEYGRQVQPFNETQDGNGVSGHATGNRFPAVYGDYTARATRD
jgi:hypothetical protein